MRQDAGSDAMLNKAVMEIIVKVIAGQQPTMTDSGLWCLQLQSQVCQLHALELEKDEREK